MQLALSTYQNRGDFYLSSKKSISYSCSSLELSNHLGNVLSVISDKVIPHPSGSTVAYYKADILQAMDYSPFGVTLKGRNLKKTGLADEFRFGYQGSEADDEMKGEGNSYTTYFRMLDPRLGRWFSIDPKSSKYPEFSPYLAMNNNPIIFNDQLGDDPPKNVHYYNMVKDKEGNYKPAYHHSHSNLVIKATKAVFRSSNNKKETNIAKANHGTQEVTTNVYTYWNDDGTINRQVVVSASLNSEVPKQQVNVVKQHVVEKEMVDRSPEAESIIETSIETKVIVLESKEEFVDQSKKGKEELINYREEWSAGSFIKTKISEKTIYGDPKNGVKINSTGQAIIKDAATEVGEGIGKSIVKRFIKKL